MFGNNSYQVAGTNALVNIAINKLKGTGLPGSLDTLQKLAVAINSDPAFASNLYDGVISDLNTLNKIANSINDDDDFYGTVTALLSTKVDNSATNLWQKYKLTETNGDALNTGLTDYNSITNPGIYGLGDGSSATMSNAPSGFSSAAKAILRIDKNSGTSDLLQTLIDLSTMNRFTRTYYGSWQSWVQEVDLNLANTWQQYKLTDTSGDVQTSILLDYNSITSTGFYGLTDGSSSTMSNAPSGFSSSAQAILGVYTFGSRLFQQLVDCSGGTVYTRAYSGSSWSSWV